MLSRAASLLGARRSVGFAWAGLVALDLGARATYLAPRLITARGALNYLAAAIVLAIALRLLAIAAHARRVWLYALVVAFPITVQWGVFRAYGTFIAPADLAAFADSPRVVFAASGQGLSLAAPLGFALALACAWLLPREARPLRWWALAPSAAAVLGAAFLGSVYWRASPTLEHPLPALSCAVAGLLEREGARAGGARASVPKDPATEPLPSIVMVVGESLAASHLGVYGYERDTTPRLRAIVDRGELLVMKDASVMGPNTRASVPYILTGVEGPDPDGRVARAPTVIEYAKSRGYHTAFVSAQEESWGALDAMFREGADTFLTGIRFAPEVGVLKGADDLVVLEQGVLPVLEKIEPPFFVVLHMDGSHVPYGTHSPASHKVFAEDGVNSVGAYDNTVRVTDEYLARVYDAVRAKDPGAWVFFTSDHGQPLGEGGAFFNHGYQSNVVRDPLLVFAPKDADRARWAELTSAQVSACDLAPTVLHLMKAKQAAPMDCVDWLDRVPAARTRVVSAYTPTWVSEPTMLLLLPDGERALYELQHGTVVMNDGAERPMSELGVPPSIGRRLH